MISSAKIAVTPDTKVKVLLPSGEVIAGKLTARTVQSKNIKDGDTVRLECKQNSDLPSTAKQTNAKGYSTCEIYFLDQRTNEAQPHPRYATIGEDGIPQESVITLERPLRWVNGKGI